MLQYALRPTPQVLYRKGLTSEGNPLLWQVGGRRSETARICCRCRSRRRRRKASAAGRSARVTLSSTTTAAC